MEEYNIEWVNDAHYGEMRADNWDARKILAKYEGLILPIKHVKKKYRGILKGFDVDNFEKYLRDSREKSI